VVTGHTDNLGSLAINNMYSKRRAERVKAKLVAEGIDTDRITVEWKAYKEPVAPNDTREGRAKNRRTEIKLVQ
jgi:OOP family OmpA-OmpF porin